MTGKPDVAALVAKLRERQWYTDDLADRAASELTRLAAENRTYAEAHAFNSERFGEMLLERDEAKAEIARLREASSLSLFARLQGKLAAIEDALDEANAPSIDGARWLTLPERVAALAALKPDTGE